LGVRKVRGVQYLNAGVVLAIERCLRIGAPRVLGVVRRVEPQAQVIGLNGIERGVRARIRERGVVEDVRRGRTARRDDEGLDAEPAAEVLKGVAVVVRL
jgi:hypothetical protein